MSCPSLWSLLEGCDVHGGLSSSSVFVCLVSFSYIFLAQSVFPGSQLLNFSALCFLESWLSLTRRVAHSIAWALGFMFTDWASCSACPHPHRNLIYRPRPTLSKYLLLLETKAKLNQIKTTAIA